MAGGFFASFPSGGGGGGVSSLDGMTGALTLIAGTGISIVDGSGTITISTSGGPFANTTLSNLDTPTAINQDLLPDSNNGRNIGAAGNSFNTGVFSELSDSAGVGSIFPNARQLISSNSTAMLDWSVAGTLNASTNIISNVVDPVNPQDAATKNYVDTVGFAFVSLSNLVSTAINAPLTFGAAVPGAISTAPTVTNQPSQAMTISTGTTTTGAASVSGGINIVTGTTSAANTGAITGAININTGDSLSTAGGNTGAINIITGHPHSNGRQSGAVTISTGATNNHSGNVTISTGNSGISASGNIALVPGTAGTTRGLIQFQNGTEGVIGQVWSTTDTVGSGSWSNFLVDQTGLKSIDYNARELLGPDGSTINLNWATLGVLDASTSKLINTSQVVIGGSTPAINNPGLTIINAANNAAFFTTGLTAGDNGMAFFAQTVGPAYIQGLKGDFSANADISLQLSGGNVLIGTGTGTGDTLVVNGSVSVAGQIHNVTDPTSPQDAATKAYVDAHASGANTALSNLASVAINSSLLPGTTNSIDLGGTTKLWNSLYIGSSGNGINLFSGLSNTGVIFPVSTTPSGATNVPSFYGTAGGTNFSVSMHTQTSSSANAVATGNVLIETGNKTAGTGNSGDIALTTGTSSGGTVGTIKLNSVTQIGTASTTLQHTLNTSSATGAQVGTFTNVPGAAGPKNPTGYIQITINGTTSYIPYFQ